MASFYNLCVLFPAISFIVHVANRYKLAKSWEKLKIKSQNNPEDLHLKAKVTQAEVS